MTQEGFVFWGVDLQKDFMDIDGALYVPDADDIKNNIRDILKLSNAIKSPVFGSMDWHPEDDVEFETFPPHCIRNTKGARVIPEARHGRDGPQRVIPTEQDWELMNVLEGVIQYRSQYTVTKTTVDVFNEPTMDKLIIPRIRGKTIIMYGVATEYCVRAAALGFLSRGFKVIIVEDAIMGIDKQKSAEALIELQIEGAIVMNVKQLSEFVIFEGVMMRLRNYAKYYIVNNELKSIVLGVSGGIDSGFTAAILSPVCKELGIPLIGAWIGIKTFTPLVRKAVQDHPDFVESSSELEHERARAVGIEFCDEFIDIDLSSLFYTMDSKILSKEDQLVSNLTMPTKIRRGNIKARMRMIYLYNLAHERGGAVMSTDNLTEHDLGFYTLHGDVGDLNLLSGLYKTEVYAIARHEVDQLEDHNQEDKADTLMDCVNAPASDGLGISKTDNAQLGGCEFEEIDMVLRNIKSKGTESRHYNHPIAKRYRQLAWKRFHPTELNRQYTMAGSFFI